MNTDVYIQSQIGVCSECIIGGKKVETSVVISPLKVKQMENELRVNSGCNMWRACENKRCQFSLASHPDIKKAG